MIAKEGREKKKFLILNKKFIKFSCKKFQRLKEEYKNCIAIHWIS